MIKQIIREYPKLYSISKLDIQVLLCFILQKPKEFLIINDDYVLTQSQLNTFNELVIKRSQNIPIAYITNSKEFYSLDFFVNEDVLIPRPETEFLVIEALKYIKQDFEVLDMGCGSGIIPITLAKHTKANIHAIDISNKALEVAKINASKHNVNINFKLSDWFSNINQKFDIITSNPPYIDVNDKHLQGEIRFEPKIALTDNNDGMQHLTNIICNAPNFLNHDGYLILEHGYDQAQKVRNLLQNSFCDIYNVKDLGNNDRITVARIKNGM